MGARMDASEVLAAARSAAVWWLALAASGYAGRACWGPGGSGAGAGGVAGAGGDVRGAAGGVRAGLLLRPEPGALFVTAGLPAASAAG